MLCTEISDKFLVSNPGLQQHFQSFNERPAKYKNVNKYEAVRATNDYGEYLKHKKTPSPFFNWTNPLDFKIKQENQPSLLASAEVSASPNTWY